MCQARVWGTFKSKYAATGQSQCKKVAKSNGLCENHNQAYLQNKGKVWSYCNVDQKHQMRKKWWGKISEDIEDFTVDKDKLINGKPVIVARWKGEGGKGIAKFIMEKVYNGEWIYNPLGYNKSLAKLNKEPSAKLPRFEWVEDELDEVLEPLFHHQYKEGILVSTYTQSVYINDGYDQIDPDNYIGIYLNGYGIAKTFTEYEEAENILKSLLISF
tara:strand:- start:282 stop:926 length:645 start_codon:yes stop_codon:yes gene_type:complete